MYQVKSYIERFRDIELFMNLELFMDIELFMDVDLFMELLDCQKSPYSLVPNRWGLE